MKVWHNQTRVSARGSWGCAAWLPDSRADPSGESELINEGVWGWRNGVGVQVGVGCLLVVKGSQEPTLFRKKKKLHIIKRGGTWEGSMRASSARQLSADRCMYRARDVEGRSASGEARARADYVLLARKGFLMCWQLAGCIGDRISRGLQYMP